MNPVHYVATHEEEIKKKYISSYYSIWSSAYGNYPPYKKTMKILQQSIQFV
jgi:hypothetical protein